MNQVWVDGVVGAGIPGDDPAITVGLSAFETLRTYGTHIFRLEQHLDRLMASCEQMMLDPPSRSELRDEIVLRAGEDTVVRITITGGGRRAIQVYPVDMERVGAPVTVATHRFSPSAALPGTVKHGSRASWMLAARRANATEVLLVDGPHILEANRSSVVAVVDGVLLTPSLDGRQLASITRGAMLEAARAAGLPMEEVLLTAGVSFSELYLCSTLKELAPVVALDGIPGPGRGPLGSALHQAFRDLVDNEALATGPLVPNPLPGR